MLGQRLHSGGASLKIVLFKKLFLLCLVRHASLARAQAAVDTSFWILALFEQLEPVLLFIISSV